MNLRTCIRSIPQLYLSKRSFYVSPVSHVKEIVHKQEGDTITIKGVDVKSPREDYLLKLPIDETHSCTTCPLCRLGKTIQIRHTDVLILNQFVSSDGKILPRRVTGLCRRQQRKMDYLIVMARHALLLPKRLPDGSIDTTEREGWRALNKYYNDDAVDDFFNTDRRKI